MKIGSNYLKSLLNYRDITGSSLNMPPPPCFLRNQENGRNQQIKVFISLPQVTHPIFKGRISGPTARPFWLMNLETVCGGER